MRFNDVAEQGSNALSGTFYAHALDTASLKAGVVAGIKSSLSISNGLDMAGPTAAPGVHI